MESLLWGALWDGGAGLANPNDGEVKICKNVFVLSNLSKPTRRGGGAGGAAPSRTWQSKAQRVTGAGGGKFGLVEEREVGEDANKWPSV